MAGIAVLVMLPHLDHTEQGQVIAKMIIAPILVIVIFGLKLLIDLARRMPWPGWLVVVGVAGGAVWSALPQDYDSCMLRLNPTKYTWAAARHRCMEHDG